MSQRTLHTDSLAQAKRLASKEPKKPRQASLRRATSSAYYALCHLLVADGAKSLSIRPTLLRTRIHSAYGHREMKAVCRQFATGQLAPRTAALLSLPVQPELEFVARTFVTAQEDRHGADYDAARQFTRLDALVNISAIEQACSLWRGIRKTANAKVFLAALLLPANWRR